MPPHPFSESRVFVKKLTVKVVATTGLAIIVTALAALVVAAPSATGTTTAHKPSTSVLVPVAAAKAAGFTKVVSAASVSTDTSVTGCPDGAQEEFANASGNLGLASEVLYCESAGDATKILKNFASQGTAQAGMKPRLGLELSDRLAAGCRNRADRPLHRLVLEFHDEQHYSNDGSAHCA